MDNLKLFVKLDKYNFRARLIPMVLALLPLYVLSTNILGIYFSNSKLYYPIGIVIAIGFSLLFEPITRQHGKNIQSKLYKEWGGIPSVAMMRFSDERINQHSKRRYRKFLAKHIIELNEVTEEFENNFPDKADEIYCSANTWLLSKTSDKPKFKRLFNENLIYGFWRNLYGAKIFALIIDIAVLTVLGVLVYKDINFLNESLNFNLIFTLLHFIILLVFVGKKRVKTQAENYAKQLLAACDNLD